MSISTGAAKRPEEQRVRGQVRRDLGFGRTEAILAQRVADARAHSEIQIARILVTPVLRPFLINPSAPRRRALSSVNLLANKRDGPLIDRSGIPCLDSCEIGFAWLVSRARAPAMALEEICRRGQRVGGVVETSAGAVVEDALGQELCMADLTVHGTARAGGEDPAIDQCQSCVKLLGEIGRPTAVIGERSHSR